jgi:hypothetical protein
VVAAPQGGHGRGEIHVGHGGVVAVDEEQGRALFAFVALGRDQVQRQAGALKADLLARHRHGAPGEPGLEGGDLQAVGAQQPRIDGAAVQWVVGAGVVGTGA